MWVYLGYDVYFFVKTLIFLSKKLVFSCFFALALVLRTKRPGVRISYGAPNCLFHYETGFFVFVAVYAIIEYSSRMRKFKNGEFQVVNVTVFSKGIGSGYRAHFYSIRINGLYENGKNVEKQFRVPKAIYDYVSVGDRAFAVKYNGNEKKKELSDLDFLPSAAD